jgi:hypothetical protein
MNFLAQYYVALGCFIWSRTSRSRAEFLFCCQQLMWMNLLYFICEGCKGRGRSGVSYSQLDKQEDNSTYQQLSPFLKVLDYDHRNPFLSSVLVIHSVWPVNRRMVFSDVRNGQKCHNTLAATHCSHAQAQAPQLYAWRTVKFWHICEKIKRTSDTINFIYSLLIYPTTALYLEHLMFMCELLRHVSVVKRPSSGSQPVPS